MIQRYLVAAVPGAIVTFGLFFIMQALITIHDGRVDDLNGAKLIDFVRLNKDQDLATKEKPKPEKEKQEEAPTPPPLSTTRAKPDAVAGGVQSKFNLDANIKASDVAISGGSVDSDATPLVRIEPQYPERAKERGIEGWVKVQYTVSPRGTIEDAVVVAYHPSTIFNNAALRAVKRWKYNPKIVNGKPVPRTLTILFPFSLGDS